MTNTVQKGKKTKDLEKSELVKLLTKLFQIPPALVKTENGMGSITVEHRIGKIGGSYTLRDILSKLGFDKLHSDFIQVMIKQIKDANERTKVINAHYVGLKNRANKILSEFRKHLEIFYGNYKTPMIPAFAFVPINDKEDGIYIQGLVTENFDLVLGDPEDIYRWCETVFTKTKKWADLNHRAESQAKALMRHQGINKDLRQRLQAICQGKIPERLGFEQK